MNTLFDGRRRNYFINRRFQSNFIIKFCVLVALGALLSGMIIYTMSKATVTTTFENSRLTIKSTADFILPAVLLSSVAVIVVIGLATILITLFTSHKIAGPLYRISKDLTEFIAGNMSVRFNIRTGDELKALALGLDTMAQKLRGDIGNIKASVAELETELASSEAKGIKISKEAKEKLEHLKWILGKFKV